eukprot:TRINITY_DN2745_c0_g1_i2.p1 TRINITY_DN2745_c0_g1~~TRINITY_DN2745_c0_g1_i2.p1  ORF type:complete len:341 (-),score=71.64 TRINITY_DN2745_c0_g1_i2:91-1113(-)
MSSFNTADPTRSVRVGGVLISAEWQDYDTPEERRWWLDQAFEQSQRAVNAGAKIVFWSEWGIFVDEFPENTTADANGPNKHYNCSSAPHMTSTFCALYNRASMLAKKNNVYFGPSFISFFSNTRDVNATNRFLLFSPDGELLFDYQKAHPVLGGEDNVLAGPKNVAFADTEYGRVAGVICADAGYPTYMQQVGRGGADLLLVPAYDWPQIYTASTPEMVPRAIENGVVMMRLTSFGRVEAVGPLGEMLLQVNTFGLPAEVPCGDHRCANTTYVLADLPAHYRRYSLYPYIGYDDLHAYACCALAAAVTVGAFVVVPVVRCVRRRRNRYHLPTGDNDSGGI